MATQKQLDALKKARAAKARKAKAKKPKKKVAITAPSRTTGKAPSKRLRSRRAKNYKAPAGYYPNPTSEYYVITVASNMGDAYFSGANNRGHTFDTHLSKAVKFPDRKIANMFAGMIKMHYDEIDIDATVRRINPNVKKK